MINTNFDFQKPLQSVQALMGLQTAAFTQTVELQKQAGQQLTSFFKGEAEKAAELKSPEDFIKFNIESNKALFELLKVQGEAFTVLAQKSGEQAMAEIQKLGN